MSVRIQPGDRQPDGPGDGYVPDPYLDRLEDNSDIRSIFGDVGDDAAELEGGAASGSDADPGRAGLFGMQRPTRNGLGQWSGASRPPWPKVVAFVVLGSLGLMLLGPFVLRLSGGPSPTQPAPAPMPKAEVASPAPSPPAEAVAPGDGGALRTVAWQGAVLPVSEQSGPRVFDRVRTSGFSRDEIGAALAAVHLSTHLDPHAGPAVFTAVVERQAVQVPDDLLAGLQDSYEAAARRARMSEAQIRRGAPVVAPMHEVHAWRVEAFMPQLADVDLLVRNAAGEDLYYRVPLVWRSGDWRLSLATATPKGLFQGVPNQDPDTFTPFATGGAQR